MKTTKILSIIVTILFSLAACKKGNTGPQGEKGDTGAPGIQGPTGSQGPEGNANVKSYKINIDLSKFIGPLTHNEFQYASDVSFLNGESIDQDDAVLIYFYTGTVGSTDYYAAMPYTDYYSTSSINNYHYFKIGANGGSNIITFGIRNSNGIAPYTNMSTGKVYYKVVLIQGESGQRPKLPKDLSYDNIKKVYNLN